MEQVYNKQYKYLKFTFTKSLFMINFNTSCLKTIEKNTIKGDYISNLNYLKFVIDYCFYKKYIKRYDYVGGLIKGNKKKRENNNKLYKGDGTIFIIPYELPADKNSISLKFRNLLDYYQPYDIFKTELENQYGIIIESDQNYATRNNSRYARIIFPIYYNDIEGIETNKNKLSLTNISNPLKKTNKRELIIDSVTKIVNKTNVIGINLKNIEFIDIKADGDCLYSCIKYGLSMDINILEMRQQVVNYWEKNVNKFKTYDNSSVEKKKVEINKQKSKGTYGELYVIQAMEILFKVRIFVFQFHEKHDFQLINVYGNFNELGKGEKFILLFLENEHYNYFKISNYEYVKQIENKKQHCDKEEDEEEEEEEVEKEEGEEGKEEYDEEEEEEEEDEIDPDKVFKVLKIIQKIKKQKEEEIKEIRKQKEEEIKEIKKQKEEEIKEIKKQKEEEINEIKTQKEKRKREEEEEKEEKEKEIKILKKKLEEKNILLKKITKLAISHSP